MISAWIQAEPIFVSCCGWLEDLVDRRATVRHSWNEDEICNGGSVNVASDRTPFGHVIRKGGHTWAHAKSKIALLWDSQAATGLGPGASLCRLEGSSLEVSTMTRRP